MTSLYETMPKPPAITRLAHIGRMPVPWVTCYRTDTDDYPVGYLQHGAADVCDCVPGEGKPLLGMQCPTRQRAAMTDRRCSTCGTRLKGVALFAGVYIHAKTDTNLAPGVPLTAEAPLHPRCLAYSALACPHLYDSNALVVPVPGDYPLLDRWRLVDTTGSDAEHRYAYMPHDTRRPLALPDGRWPIHEFVYARLDQKSLMVTTLDAWMRRSAPQPYRRYWADNRELQPPLGQLAAQSQQARTETEQP